MDRPQGRCVCMKNLAAASNRRPAIARRHKARGGLKPKGRNQPGSRSRKPRHESDVQKVEAPAQNRSLRKAPSRFEKPLARVALRTAGGGLGRRFQQLAVELVQVNKALKAEIIQRQQAEMARLQVLRRLVEAQEAERGCVARELHDEFGQKLAALSIGLKRLGEELPARSPLQSRLPTLLNLVDDALRGVHRLVWELRPPALDDLGLANALRRYSAEWSKLSGISVDFHSHSRAARNLPSQIETTLYRVAQEALTNVFKHAQAGRVSVILEGKRNHVGLIVEDDGRGFQVERAWKNGADLQGHAGLIDMRERATLAGGTINIESRPGSGTTVFVRIPLARGAGEPEGK